MRARVVSRLLLSDLGARRSNEPGHDQGSKADECDCDHFSAPSAEARDLGPSMFEVYVGSRLESVAQRWCMGGALVARRLRLGTINPGGACRRPWCGRAAITEEARQRWDRESAAQVRQALPGCETDWLTAPNRPAATPDRKRTRPHSSHAHIYSA